MEGRPGLRGSLVYLSFFALYPWQEFLFVSCHTPLAGCGGLAALQRCVHLGSLPLGPTHSRQPVLCSAVGRLCMTAGRWANVPAGGRATSCGQVTFSRWFGFCAMLRASDRVYCPVLL